MKVSELPGIRQVLLKIKKWRPEVVIMYQYFWRIFTRNQELYSGPHFLLYAIYAIEGKENIVNNMNFM